jgi:hypothetical protein
MYFYCLVENVPGLGASGYVESTSDFKTVSSEKVAQGKILLKKKRINTLVKIFMCIAYVTKSGHFVLENPNLKASFNTDGQLVELIDKKSDR